MNATVSVVVGWPDWAMIASIAVASFNSSFTPFPWAELDDAFATNCDPLTGKYPHDPAYDRLFYRIVSYAPALIGLGHS